MLTSKEAQAMLGVSMRLFYSLVQSGAIAHYRFGKRTLRFEEAQILAYKESCVIATRVPKELTVTRVNVSLSEKKSELQEYFENHKKLKDEAKKARMKSNSPKTSR